ncbi:MAG: nucleotidyltransferase domain-containing protein [Sulfurimonas sp.]|nr:nucleotidyltransferase domain-containing protein [Sulfurimonas sp.]
MLNIEELKPKIIESLKPLNLDKIILFGSYAYGTPNENSDVDLLLVKDVEEKATRQLKLEARKRVRSLISSYKVGFDFIVASNKFLKTRKDYFYRVDILQNGKVIYE